jgi:hypothetical protein
MIVIEHTLLIYDDDENRLRAYANANRLGDSATALRHLLDHADQLAEAVDALERLCEALEAGQVSTPGARARAVIAQRWREARAVVNQARGKDTTRRNRVATGGRGTGAAASATGASVRPTAECTAPNTGG